MPGKSPADSSPFSLFIFTIFSHHALVQSKRQASYCTDTNMLFPLYSHDTGNRRPDLCMSPDSALITFSYLPKDYDLLRLICRVLSGFGEISRILRAGYLLILKNAPSLQWRDRAGFAPASILASRVMDREEHRIVDEIVTAMPRSLFFFCYTSFSIGHYFYFT